MQHVTVLTHGLRGAALYMVGMPYFTCRLVLVTHQFSGASCRRWRPAGYWMACPTSNYNLCQCSTNQQPVGHPRHTLGQLPLVEMHKCSFMSWSTPQLHWWRLRFLRRGSRGHVTTGLWLSRWFLLTRATRTPDKQHSKRSPAIPLPGLGACLPISPSI